MWAMECKAGLISEQREALRRRQDRGRLAEWQRIGRLQHRPRPGETAIMEWM
jgi:hypothetical protein